jgi:BACON domain-containing protein/all-beta uncharacterized protein
MTQFQLGYTDHAGHRRTSWICVRLLAILATASIACTDASLTTPGQSAAKCQVALTGPQESVAAAGGDGFVAITAAPECVWSATTETAWISDLAPASGQGTANLRFKAAANPAAATRQGEISVNGVVIRISQNPASCTYEVAPQTVTMTANGGTGRVTVTAPAGCAWTAATDVPWVTIGSGAGTANGVVDFVVAANTGAARAGRILVETAIVSIAQSASSPTTPAVCTFSIAPSNQSFGDLGGSGSVSVTAPAACAWTATSAASWLVVTSGATGSGAGTVAFSVSVNTGAARSGTLLVAGQTFTVDQAAAAAPGPCSFTVAPLTQAINALGGVGTPITVTTGATCTWTAAANDSWIHVLLGSPGTGSGTVQLSIDPNPGGARSGTLTVAGQTVTVNQGALCLYALNPTSQSFSSGGRNNERFSVTTGSGCAWTATTTETWITINSGASGTGSGTVRFSIAQNTTGQPRTGVISVAGQIFTASQAP